jgi:hypothetical protein
MLRITCGAGGGVGFWWRIPHVAYASGELNGKHVSILNDSSDRAAEETARELSNGLNETESWRGEVRNVRKDGTRLWTSVCVSAYNATLWRVCSLPPSGRVS